VKRREYGPRRAREYALFFENLAILKVTAARSDSIDVRNRCWNPCTEADLQPSGGEITVLLRKWKDGEPSAFEDLMPLVYPHLREVAAAYIRRERNPTCCKARAGA